MFPREFERPTYDVRRTCKVNRPVTGVEIVDALKDRENYAEKLIRDVDGRRVYYIGLTSPYPAGNVEIRTGKELDNLEIELDRSYDIIGVASASMILRPSRGYSVGYSIETVIKMVESIRSLLEKKLKKKKST